MSVASDLLGSQNQSFCCCSSNCGFPNRVLTGRSRLGRLVGIELVSTGAYVPEEVVDNADLARLGCDSDWIVQRTGILQRRKAAPDQAASDLAIRAAEECIQRAGATAADVDLIIVATMTPDHPTPSTALPSAAGSWVGCTCNGCLMLRVQVLCMRCHRCPVRAFGIQSVCTGCGRGDHESYDQSGRREDLPAIWRRGRGSAPAKNGQSQQGSAELYARCGGVQSIVMYSGWWQ